MLTVLREGSESVLFLHGMATSGSSIVDIIIGGTLGLFGGIVLGLAMYFGLMRIPLRLFFSVTGTLLMFLTAGLAGQIARFLIQADLLTPLIEPLWDTSALLSTSSLIGSILHILIGYESSPSAMQMLFYASTIVIILFFTAFVKQRQQQVLN
jgi:high-affinity iron transporter